MSTGLFQDEEESYNIEETKYVLKGSAPSTDSSFDAGAESFDEPEEEEIDGMDAFDDATPEDGNSDKPFDDEPFDAGVEADEDTDPEKYIQQLSGKLGQSLRQYTEDEGQPDFDLEKFAVNSVLSATHTGEMDKGDQRDIINKVKKAGSKDTEPSTDTMNPEDSDVNVDGDMGGDAELDELKVYENLFLNKTNKNNMFQGGSNDILEESDRCTKIAKRKYDVWPSAYASGAVVKCRKGKIWKGIKEEDLDKLGDYKKMTDEQIDEAAKKTDFSKEKESGLHGWFSRRGGEGSSGWVDCNTCRDGKCKPCGRKEGEKRSEYPSCRPTPSACKTKGRGESWGKKAANENKLSIYQQNQEEESNNYMFWQNIKGIYDNATEILGMNEQEVDTLITNGHQWAVEHVITSKDDVEEVYHFIEAALEGLVINEGEHELNNYMFWSSLKTIQHASKELLEMDYNSVDALLSDGHGWALDHIATSNDDMEEVYHFLTNTLDAYDCDSKAGYEDEYGTVENIDIYEGKYDDKPLGKPMKGDVKKFKVYVKNEKGNVVKVNFGDPNMEIRRDDPEARKSFRARHKCSEKKDRTTPGYWSCKMWSTKKVSDMLGESKNKKESSMLGAGYTHFAIFKSNNIIANGWDYKSLYDKYEKAYDNESILEYSREDMMNDFPDNKVSDFKIVTRKYLEKNGINPSDNNNWYKISENNLQESKKYSTFVDKTKLIKDLRLMENSEPMIQPITKPATKPSRPMRETDRPFLPKRKDKVNPKPKANVSKGGSSTVEFNGKQVDVNSLEIDGVDRSNYPDFVDAYFTYAEYSDGRNLTDIELQKFTDENGELLNELIFDRQLYM